MIAHTEGFDPLSDRQAIKLFLSKSFLMPASSLKSAVVDLFFTAYASERAYNIENSNFIITYRGTLHFKSIESFRQRQTQNKQHPKTKLMGNEILFGADDDRRNGKKIVHIYKIDSVIGRELRCCSE